MNGLPSRFFFKFLFVILATQVHDTCGQSFFSVLPDLHGVDMEGGCRNVYPLDTNFIVFGHRKDTSYGGSIRKPLISIFDYQSYLEDIYALIDTSYDAGFNISFIQFAEKNSTRWFGLSTRFINSVSTPYLFEVDLNTGDIVSSRLIVNSNQPEEGSGISNIFYSDNLISILSYQQDADSVRLYITELDSAMTLMREFRVEAGVSKQFPKYFERQDDGTYIIIADAKRYLQNGNNIFDAAFLKLDTNGQILKFKWSPSHIPIANLLTAAKSVIKGSNGSWVLLGTHFLYPDSCTNCSVSIPYKYSISPEFDSVLWQVAYRDVSLYAEVLYHEYAVSEVADGFIGCGEFFPTNTDPFPSSGRIYKTSLNGDSLWTRHFIPIDWDDDRVVFANFYDVKETPFGTLVVVGDVVDKELEITRPWILHLDKDGCLFEDCNTVSANPIQPERKIFNQFKVFPNPTSEELYFSSSLGTSTSITIDLVTLDGKKVKSTALHCIPGFYYMVSLHTVPPGQYVVVFKDEFHNLMESQLILRQ